MPLFHHRAQPAGSGIPLATPFRAGGQSGIAPETAAPALTFSGTHTLLADCSEFQADIADAAYLKWSKAIVIRAAYGDAHDDSAWYNGARRADLHAGGALFIGIYQFLVAGQDGAAQADTLHGLVGALQKGEVLIADFEQGGKAMLTAWYNRMTALGYPGKYLWTYTGLDFGQAQGVLPVQWLAAYQSVEPAGAHTLWQFTGSYQVPGVGVADASVYHGSISALAALASPGTAAKPPAAAPKAGSATPAPTGLRQSVRATGWAVTCTWEPVKGETSYHFQLESYKKGFGWVLGLDERVSDPANTVAVAPATQYRWRVAAGESGYTWPAWQEFTTS